MFKVEYQDYVNDMKNFSNNRPQFSRDPYLHQHLIFLISKTLFLTLKI